MLQVVSYTVDDLHLICDGNTDCESGDDELFCPGRFYCNKEAGQVRGAVLLQQRCWSGELSIGEVNQRDSRKIHR